MHPHNWSGIATPADGLRRQPVTGRPCGPLVGSDFPVPINFKTITYETFIENFASIGRSVPEEHELIILIY